MVALKMKYRVYVLYSNKLRSYYAGYTRNLDDRIQRHNSGRSKYTSKGIPWILIKTFECESAIEAVRLEKKIKSRGIKRYLDES
ncbi:GIY-YIG nuclease family protein [Robiginitalea sp. IMCC44478]|uniref:GIY-YIG nuclease family protein n=1 Tax=Robiginitalea sp. IMCC44478 TaxID=3459122 RepID=UPI004042D887